MLYSKSVVTILLLASTARAIPFSAGGKLDNGGLSAAISSRLDRRRADGPMAVRILSDGRLVEKPADETSGQQGRGGKHRGHKGQEKGKSQGQAKGRGHGQGEIGKKGKHGHGEIGKHREHGQKQLGSHRDGQMDASPQGNNTSSQRSGAGGDTFAIHIVNSCSTTKSFGIYGVTSSFQAQQYGPAVSIPPGGSNVLHAPFQAIGLRLTANAQEGISNVFLPQTLFEFGYSSYSGQEGTAYDLSLMQPGAELGIAVQVLPNGQGSQTCESKSCPSPGNCPSSQGWTNPDQTSLGNPADTVCYKGKTDFLVTWCPSG